MVAALILAAGGSRRFGSQKLLAPFGGKPLLEHAIDNASESSVQRLLCVLGSDADEITAGVAFGRAETLTCEEWRLGQSAALRAAVSELSSSEAIVVLLGDEPLVTADAIERVLGARGPGACAVRATYGAVPGHPTVIEKALFPKVAQISGDSGAKDLFSPSETRYVPCDDCASAFDIDTPADLELLERNFTVTPPERKGHQC